MSPGYQPTWAVLDAIQALNLALSTLPRALAGCIANPVDTRPVAQLLDNLVFLGKSLEMQEEQEQMKLSEGEEQGPHTNLFLERA